MKISENKSKLLFSEYFEIDKNVLEEHDVFDISLYYDSPVFIDPFLLFYNEDKILQNVHQNILDYFSFLKNVTLNHQKSTALISEFFLFQEVKELWLGYCEYGNEGSGPGIKFGQRLFDNLSKLDIFTGNKSELIKSEHIEKITLLDPGIGKDCISDLTANLIKPYLLEYTQSFSEKYLDDSRCGTFSVKHASFKYGSGILNLGRWINEKYYLPRHPFKQSEYIILTPKSILAKDDYWINRTDMVSGFDEIVQSVDDSQLRAQFNYYISEALRKKQQEENLKSKKPRKVRLNKKDKKQAIEKLINDNPEFIDYFIKYKEDTGGRAVIKASAEVISVIEENPELPKAQFLSFLKETFKEKGLTKPTVSYDDALKCVLHMKNCIENKGVHKTLYKDEKLCCDEKFFQNIFKLVTHSLNSDVNAEVNNGRGPADFIFSNGSKDKTIVEFKLASNTNLENNLKNQVEIYKTASDAHHHIHVIFVFSEAEQKRLERICNNIGYSFDSENFVVIDARNDNKPSGSKAK